MPYPKDIKRIKRHNKIRSRIKGTESRPRLIVYRSLNYTYGQLINDENGKCLVAFSDLKRDKKITKSDSAKSIGLELAKKALKQKIESCVFDRNGYKYHGRVKALADGAREGGLKF